MIGDPILSADNPQTSPMNTAKILATILILATSACSSYAERVANTCGRLGYDRGTEMFGACMDSQMQNDSRDRDRWAGIAGLGFGYAAASRRSSVTSCSSFGGMATCVTP